jgi:hypothetical protein
MPPVPELVETVRKHGSPLRDDLVSRVAPAPAPRAREIALLRVVGDGFRVGRPARGGTATRLSLVAIEDLVAEQDGHCYVLRKVGPRAAATLSALGGTRIRVTTVSRVDSAALLGHDFPPSRSVELDLAAGSPADVQIPDTGDGGMWQVRLDLQDATGRARVCGIRPT